MEPVSLVLGLLVVTGCLHVTTRVVADGIATIRAAKAGEWALIDRERERRAGRSERWALAWAERRRRRHEQAGGDGDYRPGARAYAQDVYQGFWEDRLARRNAKRAARPEYVYDPDRKPWHVRVDEAIADKVGRARAAWGQYRQQRATDVPVKPEPVPLVESGDVPIGTIRHTDDGIERWDGHRWALADAALENADATWSPPPSDLHDLVPVGYGPDGAPYKCPNCRSTLNLPATYCHTCIVRVAMRDGRPTMIRDSSGQFTADDVARRNASESSEPSTPDMGDTAMTAPTINPTVDVTEVNTNEDARQNFAAMAAAAAEAQEALAMLEAARAKMAAAAQATQDGVSAKAFDVGATAAANEAVDAIGLDTLGGWAELIDNVMASADKGIAGLDKYRDSEAQVAEERIDPTVLASTSS